MMYGTCSRLQILLAALFGLLRDVSRIPSKGTSQRSPHLSTDAFRFMRRRSSSIRGRGPLVVIRRTARPTPQPCSDAPPLTCLRAAFAGIVVCEEDVASSFGPLGLCASDGT
ncbi:hypothetical protein C8Q78DRAFT_412349 [Trametes maxima]|nr:hypothetical protein C8Q78DRAFT_412349 [Trametes maxima]